MIVGKVLSEYDGLKLAAASVVAAFPAKSLINPAVTSTSSGVLVDPKPSAPNPTVVSIAAAAVSVSWIVSTVALVITADVMSEAENVIPVLAALLSRSQTNFDQSNADFTSVPDEAIVVNLVPVRTI